MKYSKFNTFFHKNHEKNKCKEMGRQEVSDSDSIQNDLKDKVPKFLNDLLAELLYMRLSSVCLGIFR